MVFFKTACIPCSQLCRTRSSNLEVIGNQEEKSAKVPEQYLDHNLHLKFKQRYVAACLSVSSWNSRLFHTNPERTVKARDRWNA